MDKHKDNGICMGQNTLLKYVIEVVPMGSMNIELFNNVYKEISQELGIDTALTIYQLFKGTQITFPTRLFNPEYVKTQVVFEYDGNNVKQLATKYQYSEKTIRRIIKENIINKKGN